MTTDFVNTLPAHLKIAVVHDWVFVRRGGEKVLEEILNMFPTAEVFFLFGNPQKVLKLQNKHCFYASFLNKLPWVHKYYKLLLPLLPVAIESFNLINYDIIISSSSCVAKGIIPGPHSTHVAYLHSPMRYAWDQESFYFPKKPSFGAPFELLRRMFLSKLRQWDVTSSVRIDALVANSGFVARRICAYYGRTAHVIYPPVAINKFSEIKRFSIAKVLIFGAWVPYKRMLWGLEILAEAGIEVIAAGQGESLVAAAKKYKNRANVEFCLNPTDEDVLKLYQKAKVLLFPSIEDFGIIPVEAMAAGVLVVAPSIGGTGETVINNLNGFHFEHNNAASLLQSVQKALQMPPLNGLSLAQTVHLEQFLPQSFRTKLYSAISNAWKNKQNATWGQAPHEGEQS